jgi:hypothetical protein
MACTRATQAIHGERRHVLRDSTVDRGDAGKIHVLRLCMNDVAKHNVTDLSSATFARCNFTLCFARCLAPVRLRADAFGDYMFG